MHLAADVKNPDNMSRSDKLDMILYLASSSGHAEAQKFWVRHCSGISKKAFDKKLDAKIKG